MKNLILIITLLTLTGCGKKTHELIKIENTKTYVKTISCYSNNYQPKECLVNEFAVLRTVNVLQNTSNVKCEKDVNFYMLSNRIEVFDGCRAKFVVEFELQ